MNIGMLNEVTAFAAKQATASMSKLLNQPMEVEILPVSVIDRNKNDEIKLLRKNDVDSVITIAEITGSVDGNALFTLSRVSALSLCDLLFHKKNGSTGSMDELEQSGILEVGNIVIGNFLTSISNYSSFNNITHKNPVLYINSKKTHPVVNNEKTYEENLVVRTSFCVRQKKIMGECIFLFNQRILDE